MDPVTCCLMSQIEFICRYVAHEYILWLLVVMVIVVPESGLHHREGTCTLNR